MAYFNSNGGAYTTAAQPATYTANVTMAGPTRTIGAGAFSTGGAITSTAAGGYGNVAGQPGALNMYAGTSAPTNTIGYAATSAATNTISYGGNSAPTNTISYGGTSAPTNTLGYAGTAAATNTVSASNPFANILAGGATGAIGANVMGGTAAGGAGAGATSAPGVPNLFSPGGQFNFFSPGAPGPPDVQSQLASPPPMGSPMQPAMPPIMSPMQQGGMGMPEFMGVPSPASPASAQRDLPGQQMPPLPFSQEQNMPALPGTPRGLPQGGGPIPMPPEGLQPGDHIEVWSKSFQNWCPGIIEGLEGTMVNVKFRAPQGNYLQKSVPNGHDELRLIKSAAQSMPANDAPTTMPNGVPPFEPPGAFQSQAAPLGVTQSIPRGPPLPTQTQQYRPQQQLPGVLVDTEEDIVDASRREGQGRKGRTGLSQGALHGMNPIGNLSAAEHAETGDAAVNFRVQKHASNAANDIVHEAMFMAKFVNREKTDCLDRDWSGPNGQNPLLTLFRTGESAAVANAFERLSGEVQQVLASQPSLGRAQAPCKVYGDIHGQFRDFLLLLHNYGFPSETGPTFIFNGDWADRGRHQLEVISLVFALKALYPHKVWLLRGNHEDPVQNQNMGAQGLEAECHTKMGAYGARVFQAIHGAFSWLPLGCLINDRVLCVHGGIGAGNWNVGYLENLPAHVARPLGHDKIPADPVVYNVLWSDPIPDDGESRAEITGVHDSPRDGHAHMIVTFGRDITERFCQMNNLDMIIRSHQAICHGFGYDVMHGGKLVRVFSARDYEGSGNDGCVLHVVEQNGHLLVRPQVLRSHAFPKDQQIVAGQEFQPPGGGRRDHGDMCCVR